VEEALALDPLPDLYIIQTVDNDIQCDGSDADNALAYGDKIDAVLASINEGAPDARIFIVGIVATSQNYTDVISAFPDAVSQNQGGGVCDAFDENGAEIPEAIAYYDEIVEGYTSELRDGCTEAQHCTLGADEIINMVIDATDLTSDHSHLTVTGHHKMAEVAWEVIGD
jgi:hypothetical protein